MVVTVITSKIKDQLAIMITTATAAAKSDNLIVSADGGGSDCCSIVVIFYRNDLLAIRFVGGAAMSIVSFLVGRQTCLSLLLGGSVVSLVY